MEFLIIILAVTVLYLIIPSKKELCSDEWDLSDIDGGTYGDKPLPVKKKTRRKTKKVALPKKAKKKVVKKKVVKRKVTKRKPKKWLI